MHKDTLLLAGFGQLNSELAKLVAEEFTVTALSRSPKVSKEISHVSVDLSQIFPDKLRQQSFDYVVFCLSPGNYDEASYQAVYGTALKNVIGALKDSPPKRFFLVSSTSVYHQNADEWVDENSSTLPSSFAGKQLLEGERLLTAAPFETTAIRFSGIYGGDRTRLLEQVSRGAFNPEGPSAYSNRIHEKDAVGVMSHLLRKAAKGEVLADCYLASDSEPTRLHMVTRWIADQLGCSASRSDQAAGAAGSGIARRSAGSKRCSNRRLIESGFRFQYPDFRAGYGVMIERWLRSPP